MNKNNTIFLVLIAFVLGGIGGYMLNNQARDNIGPVMMAQDQENDVVPMGMHRMPDGSMMGNDGNVSNMNGMGHMVSITVSSEREFIEGMIPHHQEAIDTAKQVLARGGATPEMRKLAEDIITAQEQEIAEMKKWYEAWYGEPYNDNGQYMPMMRDLGPLSGEDLDRTFLEDMIMHHMGAIMMARSVEPYIEHQEIADLAEAIIDTQAKEIQLMQSLLQ
jgi:uncharacterized protein (DUF305 family)